jgi:glycosyltransferase involved in cell wall biosynthesis
MATLPYFVFSPNSIISLIGLLRGPDPTVPTPAEDWRRATVDVVIPALNEERTIAACLASVARQTVRPRRVLLVDDGSRDRTIAIAEAFCAGAGLPLTVIRRRSPIGKTPTIKRQARELDSDVEFILDGDTILDSDDYLARTVEELYKAVGVASACGTIMPLRQRDRRRFDARSPQREFVERVPAARLVNGRPWPRRFASGITNLYREVLYLFLQRFIYLGQMVAFGSITNPVGCAVAYRRKYVKDLFDKYSPIFGDDLTNSEDIFIGFALVNEGYRNVQLHDVYARTVEPEIQRIPRQVYLWSSSFLQCCYYFDDLLRSAPRATRAWLFRRRGIRQPERRPAPVTAPVPAPVPVFVPMEEPELALVGAGAPASRGPIAPRLDWPGAGGPLDPVTPHVDGSLDSLKARAAEAEGIERRRIAEPYRQPFGVAHTQRFGRPIGWIVLTSAIEKVGFPTALLIMILCAAWEPLVVTIAAETVVSLTALVLVTRGQRLEYLVKGIAIAPLRYAMLALDAVTLGRFASDLWITRNRKWRK